MRSLRSAALVACLALFCAAPPSTRPKTIAAPDAAIPPRAVGTLEGDFSVSANGAATYTMDLEVPPGTHGQNPNLSIWYMSQGANGLLGNAFTLQGLSSITRCQASLRLDGYNGGIGFDANDRFCLDGQRLVKISGGGAYGAAGSIYHTENETWTQITAAGTCGNGPCSFTVQNKDGWTLLFGTGTSGAKLPGRLDVIAWQIDTSTDLNGNRVAVDYAFNATTLQNLPSAVRYTGNDAAGMAANRKVTFEYEPRAQNIPRYAGGQRFLLDRRLKAIRTWLDGTQVLNYFFGYQTSDGTGRDLLGTLQKCTAAGDCFPATTFQWQEETNALVTPNSSAEGTLKTGWCTEENALIGWSDFNADGLPDIHCDTPAGTHRVLLSTGTSLVTPNANADGTVKTGWCSGDGFTASWADFNGDAKADLTCSGNDGTHRVLVSDGKTVASPNSSADGTIKTSWCAGDNSTPQWGNFNADGRADLLCNSTDGVQRALLSTGTGVVSPNSSADGVVRTGWCTASDASVFWGDFNGDHLSDAHCAVSSTGVQQVLLSNGTQLVTPNADANGTVATSWCAGSDRLRGATDFNGDGLLDSSCDSSDGRHWVLLSTGRSLTAPNAAADGLLKSSWCIGDSAVPSWADFNGDGLADLQCRDGGSRVMSLLSTGTGLRSPNASAEGVLRSGWCPASQGNISWADINADGLNDALCSSGGGLQQALIHTPGAPDLASRITNGVGMTVDLTYAPLTDATVYTAGDPVTYPALETRSPLYVVSRYVNGDGRGSFYPFRYKYRGARTDLESQRWLGFQQVTMTVESIGRQTVTNYAQAYPLMSFVTSMQILDSGGRTLASNTYTPLIRNPYPNVFDVLTATESEATFTNGRADYTLVKTYDYDPYSNVMYEATVAAGFFEVYTCTKYDNLTSPWRLGYPASQKTTRTADSCRAFLAAGEPVWDPAADLRWSLTDYDARMNVAAQKSWDDGNQVFLTLGRTYDAVGNALTRTDVGGHVTTYTWDPTFTFPASQTSPPLEGGRTLTTSYTFHRAFGEPATTTDANGNVESRAIDGFGRVTSLSGPDPTSSSGAATVPLRTFSYAQDGNGRYVELRARHTWADGNQTNWFYNRQYQDGLGRVYRDQRRSARPDLDVVVENLFDSVGRPWKQAVPHYTDTVPDYVVTLYDLLDRPTTVTQPDGTIAKMEYLQGEIQVRTTEAFGTEYARTMTDSNDPRELTLQNTAPNDGITASTFDPLGEQLTMVRPNGSSTTATWDSLGRPVTSIDSNTGTSTWSYGADGLVKTATDGAGNTVAFRYDALNRPVTRTLTSTTGTVQTYTYGYDDPAVANGLGNLTSVTGPDYAENYSYSRYDLIAIEELAIGGNVFLDKADYSPQGRQSLRTFADGSVLRTTHFVDGTLNALDMAPSGGEFANVATYTAYTAQEQPQSLLFANGLKTDTTYYSVAESMARPHVTSVTRQASPTTTLFSRTYTWTPLTQMKTLARTSGGGAPETDTFVFDDMGWLRSVSGAAGEETYQYDTAGNITLKDGVEYRYKPTTDQASDASTGSTFGYDGAGNLNARRLTSSSWRYNHDAGGRLATVQLNDVAVSTNLYDSDDNRIRHIDEAGGVSIYIAEDIDLYQSGGQSVLTKYVRGVSTPLAAISTTYTPQSLQSMLLAQKTELDAGRYSRRSVRGILLSAAATLRAIAFRYGAKAIVPAVGALLFLAASFLLLRQRRSGRRGPVFTSVIPFLILGLMLLSPQELRADLGPGNGYPEPGTLYFQGDQIDSTILVTTPDGNESTRVGYDPFGGIDPARSAGPNNFRPKFTSKEHDSGSRLDYFGARYYDSELARFLEPDPESQYASPYVYAGNDPIDRYDPDGRLAILAAVLIGAAMGIGAYFGGVAVNNNNYNPFQWDWGSGRTLAGIFAGAAIGAATAAIGAAIGTASIAAGIAAEVILSAAENAAFTALGGGSAKEIMFSALIGGVAGGVGAGVGAGLSRAFARSASSGSRLARRASSEALTPELNASRFAGATCSSFPAGTLVALEGTPAPIETIVPGTSVLSQEDQHTKVAPFPVLATYTRREAKLVDVTVGRTTVTSTPNHPFWVADRGWTQAAQLRPHDMLVTAEGKQLPVRQVTALSTTAPVYNFEVGQAHTYFVSPLQLLVHNPRCTRGLRAKMAKKGVDTNNIIEGRRLTRRPDRYGWGIRRYGPGAPRLRGGRYVDFTSVATHTVRINLTGRNAADFALADARAGLRRGHRQRHRMTWHHVEDVAVTPTGNYQGTLQLVPTNVHQQWPHWGGESVYRRLTGGGY